MDRTRVVITGLGPVTNLGIGLKEYLNGLMGGVPRVKPIPESFLQAYSYKSRFYSPLPEINLEKFGLNSTFEKIHQQGDRMVLAGIKLALEDAGFDLSQGRNGSWSFDGNTHTDLILGTGIGSLQEAFIANMAHTHQDNSQQETLIGRKIRMNRMVIPMTMPSAAPAWASIIFGLGGASFSLNASCASGTIAIGEAFLRIQSGQSSRVIAGGMENLRDGFGGIMRGFDQIGTLTRNEDGVPKPFTESRSGFLFSEGAAGLLVLEEYDSAIKRNARIYGEILSYRNISEAYSIVQIDPSGEGIRRLLSPLVDEFPLDIVNVHGTGTQANDSAEANVLNELFGEKLPQIQLTKGLLGHTIGASGALEAITLVNSLYTGLSHPQYAEGPFAGIPLTTEQTSGDFHYGLSHSFGFGGHNAALVMRKL